MPSAPALGALGVTFTAMRIMEGIALLTIIGLSANFISDAVNAGYVAPPPLVGTLVVSCLATLYIAISYILYYDSMLPMLIATGADAAVLIMVIVVAVLLGKPVSYLQCESYPSKGNTANFIHSVYSNVKKTNSNVFLWVDPDKTACYEVKAVWGLSTALCIMFAMSAIVSVCLWRRIKGPSSEPPKDLE